MRVEATWTTRRKRRRLIANRKLHAAKNSDRHHQTAQKVLQHTWSANIPLVADAEVASRRSMSYFNEKYCLRNSSWAGDILPGVMRHYSLEFGKHGEPLADRRILQGWKRCTPPGAGILTCDTCGPCCGR